MQRINHRLDTFWRTNKTENKSERLCRMTFIWKQKGIACHDELWWDLRILRQGNILNSQERHFWCTLDTKLTDVGDRVPKLESACRWRCLCWAGVYWEWPMEVVSVLQNVLCMDAVTWDRVHVCEGIAHGLQSYPEQYFSQAGLRTPLFGYSPALMHLGVMTKWLGISNFQRCGLSSFDVWNCHWLRYWARGSLSRLCVLLSSHRCLLRFHTTTGWFSL